MMRKKIVSLCMALALCLGLLPVTALAAAPDGQVIYVGNENVTSGGYWTTGNDGTVTAFTGDDTPADNYIHYNANDNILTLHNATIKKELEYNDESPLYITGAAIGVINQSGDANLTITLEGTNTIEDVSYGIRVYALSIGSANLTITGSGTLYVNLNQEPIQVNSSKGNATLSIKNAKVTAKSSYGNGVTVQSGNSENSSASLTVDGGSLTATADSNNVSGIRFQLGTSGTGNGTPTVTVSNNAIVRATGTAGGITSNSSAAVQTAADIGESGGIVFDGNTGTVYGKVELQEDLEIGEGESLTLDDDATLDANGHNVIVDGGTLGEGLAESLDDSVIYKVTQVELDKTSLTLDVNESETLTATITPGNATNKTVTWDSSAPGVATVDTSGKVTAVAQGSTTITATAADGSGKSATCTVTVNEAETVPVESVSLDKSNLELTEGGTDTLTATITPSNASNKSVTWSSDNESVATVTNGVVTAVTPGIATITVTTADQSKTATCEVTVAAATVPVTGVTLSQNEAHLYYNRTPNTLTLTATVAPDNATNKAVTWTSSNPSVATVENGVVTAAARGTAVITATAADGSGASASCTVTVSSYLPPANSNYKITVEATQGGTVTADPTAAKAGATVTLTPAPDAGYQVGTVAVTDRFGEAVAVTENADGTYVFTMPNGQVTVTVTFEQAPLPFHDVTEGDWFYDAVRYAYENGLMDGVGEGQFAPNSETTRAQLVTILHRLAGEPEPGGDSGFSDVAAGTWYTDAVAWAAENGIVNGTTDTTFAPGEDITREQLVTVLYRYAESKGYDVSASADLSGYPDAGQVQDYAQPAMAWAVAEGIVEGVDGTLNPAGNASRAQIATILMRFCEGVAK